MRGAVLRLGFLPESRVPVDVRPPHHPDFDVACSREEHRPEVGARFAFQARPESAASLRG